MARVAPVVPAETDILCESCGYTLNGLPESGNCPECGEPITASTVEDGREPPSWESESNQTVATFVSTTFAIIFQPTRFFRTITARGDLLAAQTFARSHWLLASILFALTGTFHVRWFLGLNAAYNSTIWSSVALPIVLIALVYLVLAYVTKLAARLSTWEATYRGYRLPFSTVMRGMYYHAGHYVPVALIACITVAGYTTLFSAGVFTPLSATRYLYVLSAEVIVGAAYLFNTYWIAMRNMMYANR